MNDRIQRLKEEALANITKARTALNKIVTDAEYEGYLFISDKAFILEAKLMDLQEEIYEKFE